MRGGRHHVPTAGVSGTYLCDVMYLKDYIGVNQKRSAIFLVVNVNTRFTYARGLISPITSQKAATALKSILDEIDASEPFKKMKILRSDGGAENLGELQSVLKKRGIQHEKLEARTHEKLARLDRIVGSIRMIIGELFSKNNNNVWYHSNMIPMLEISVSPYRERTGDTHMVQTWYHCDLLSVPYTYEYFGSTDTTAGDLYYLDSSGNWALADADTLVASTGMLAVACGNSSDASG